MNSSTLGLTLEYEISGSFDGVDLGPRSERGQLFDNDVEKPLCLLAR